MNRIKYLHSKAFLILRQNLGHVMVFDTNQRPRAECDCIMLFLLLYPMLFWMMYDTILDPLNLPAGIDIGQHGAASMFVLYSILIKSGVAIEHFRPKILNQIKY